MQKLSFGTDCLKTAPNTEGTQEVGIWVTSLQGMTAALVEHLRAANDHSPVSVSTIMMFHDKKLGANRAEVGQTSLNDKTRKELDCVIAAGERARLMRNIMNLKLNVIFRSAMETPFE